MTEQLLQYIWRFQYYNKSSLLTEAGERLQIIHPGTYNNNQGPDFLNAKIKIDNTIWAGSIELHLKTSHWQSHGHDGDENYSNVILHVVFDNDGVQNKLPILSLKDKIAGSLLHRYRHLMESRQFIACQNIVQSVSALTIASFTERLIAERLTRKSKIVFEYLQQNQQHWEESFWWLLAKNFGTKVNADAFEAIAKSISINILARHKNQVIQLEAILLGQAGLLQQPLEDAYAVLLQKEYQFLSAKYNLKPIAFPVHFLRMRPGNFPTVRLAQLAALVSQSAHLFSKIVEEPSLQKVKQWFTVEANDFWHYHYRLTDASVFKKKNLGADMIDNIIINTIVPVLFAYGLAHNNQAMQDKSLLWLQQTSAENNTIIKGFKSLDFHIPSAFHSQALIELYNNYCEPKKCLQCSIGNSLLKNA